MKEFEAESQENIVQFVDALVEESGNNIVADVLADATRRYEMTSRKRKNSQDDGENESRDQPPFPGGGMKKRDSQKEKD